MNTQAFFVSVKSFAWIVVATVAGVGMVVLLPTRSLAQAQNDAAPTVVDPLKDFQSPDASSDPFSSRGDNSSGVFDLIHRAMQSSGKSFEDFSAEQEDNLDSEAAQFRKQQLELLRQRQQAEQTTPASSSSSGN
ncbi:MAG: hypothetical protein KME16_05185 [Scytolyngbya sp. HA4215-MV1]|jgi:hypothetical protein|nr:hypothetical protein [Scytolyngbya sp. HA4215-MV1]